MDKRKIIYKVADKPVNKFEKACQRFMNRFNFTDVIYFQGEFLFRHPSSYDDHPFMQEFCQEEFIRGSQTRNKWKQLQRWYFKGKR